MQGEPTLLATTFTELIEVVKYPKTIWGYSFRPLGDSARVAAISASARWRRASTSAARAVSWSGGRGMVRTFLIAVTGFAVGLIDDRRGICPSATPEGASGSREGVCGGGTRDKF